MAAVVWSNQSAQPFLESFFELLLVSESEVLGIESEDKLCTLGLGMGMSQFFMTWGVNKNS